MIRTAQHDVAAEVRAQLARHRRSGRSIALQAGWGQAYLHRRLIGEVAFDVNDLATIAAILDVPITSFFDGRQLTNQLSGNAPRPEVRTPGYCLAA